jgi:peptide/nickel transport system substrate-binding protein
MVSVRLQGPGAHRRRGGRRVVLVLGALALLASACGGTSASAGGESNNTLIIGMTATNLPGTDGQYAQSEGGEGLRFVGLMMYDGLTKMDLLQGDHTPEIKPGLAESWTVSPDASTWTFKLRPGVKFHDGSPWNADAAVWNLNRMAIKSSPEFEQEINSLGGLLLGGVQSVTKDDDMTITIKTPGPYSYLDTDLSLVTMVSPEAFKKAGGHDKFSEAPSGTGPFKFESMSRGQQLTMVRNDDYWGPKAKLDKLVLRPVPDATARVAALRSGEVNWIEVPPPDEVPTLRDAGFQMLTNAYSHVWPWVLDTTKPPFDDVRVRQAVNYAINRDAITKDILQGTGRSALQYAPKGDPGYNPALDTYSYDPAKAKQLLADAGYANGVTIDVVFPPSGSGNMVPVPMNEAMQRDLAAVGVKVNLKPLEWSALLGDYFNGNVPQQANAVNISLGFVFPSLWGTFFLSDSSVNVGKAKSPEVDAAINKAKTKLDPKERAAAFEEANKALLDEAPWLLVVNDLNPRTLAPNVKGFVMPQSWYIDLTTVTVE